MKTFNELKVKDTIFFEDSYGVINKILRKSSLTTFEYIICSRRTSYYGAIYIIDVPKECLNKVSFITNKVDNYGRKLADTIPQAHTIYADPITAIEDMYYHYINFYLDIINKFDCHE